MTVSMRKRRGLLVVFMTVASLSFAQATEVNPNQFTIKDAVYEQGGVVRGYVTPGSQVTLDGRYVQVAPDGAIIFGFDRDYRAKATLAITYPDTTSETHSFDIASKTYNIERIDGLPPSKVTPRTKEQIDHIMRDQKMKSDSRKNPARETWFMEDWAWPMTGRMSGFYGSQRVLNGEPKRPHYGVDIAAPTGTNFYAPAGGIVTLASTDMYFEGGLIFLDHGHGFTSGFLHISRTDVEVGEVVEKGDLLGGVGAAGRATGPHLDWRITWMGQQIDPTSLVGPLPTDEVGPQPGLEPAIEQVAAPADNVAGDDQNDTTSD